MWVVQEKTGGLGQQLDGNAGALALTAGQCPHLDVPARRQIKCRQRPVDRGVHLADEGSGKRKAAAYRRCVRAAGPCG